MKTYFFRLIALSATFSQVLPSVYAEDTKGNILGIHFKKLREGDVDMNTIPVAIAGVIEWLLAIAGTVSVVALIYHSVQMQLNSGITGDSS